MHDEHPFAREGGAPRVGVVVGLQGAQLGKAGRVTAADDLPLGPDVPEGEQFGALRSLDVEAAEFVQRGIVGGKDARQIPNVRPRAVREIVPAVLQPVGHGAHLGGTAAAKQERLTALEQVAHQVVAGSGGQDVHAAVFHCKAQTAVEVGGLLQKRIVVIHWLFPFWAAGSGPARHCSATESFRSRGSGRRGPWRRWFCPALRPARARWRTAGR